MLAKDFSLESEGLQVSSGLQDSSQYSGWSQQCCSLNGLNSSTDHQLFNAKQSVIMFNTIFKEKGKVDMVFNMNFLFSSQCKKYTMTAEPGVCCSLKFSIFSNLTDKYYILWTGLKVWEVNNGKRGLKNRQKEKV